MSEYVPFAHMAVKPASKRKRTWSPRDIQGELAPPVVVRDLADPDLTPGERLTLLRQAEGLYSAAQMGKHLGISPVTYQHHENGRREISRKAADRYAAHFNVTAALILYGQSPTDRRVPVVGVVTGLAKIVPRMSMSRKQLQHLDMPAMVKAPPLAERELEALIVNTRDLHPVFKLGDVVFYEATAEIDVTAVEGTECVVETVGGHTLLCTPHLTNHGLWRLELYNNSGVQVVGLNRAAPVLWVQRRGWKTPVTTQ